MGGRFLWILCLGCSVSSHLSLMQVSWVWHGTVPYSSKQLRRDPVRYPRPDSGDHTAEQLIQEHQLMVSNEGPLGVEGLRDPSLA